MKRVRLNTICIILLVLLFIWQFLIPKDFSSAARGLSPESVTACRMDCYVTEETENGPEIVVHQYEIDPASDLYSSIMEQFSSVKYKKQLLNMMGGGQKHGYEITLSPYAVIYLEQPEGQYTIGLYGGDLSFGKSDSRMTDFTPSGGDAFQAAIIASVQENATEILNP